MTDLSLGAKIRIGIVDYRNARPLLFGLQHHPEMDRLASVSAHYPAEVAKQLLDDTIDIGLVPVAIIPELREPVIVSDYCIGADGKVASVCLFSNVPLADIETVYLDYQSRTSVQLCRLLMRDFWKKEVAFQPATPDYIQLIGGTTAGVIIGDRALEQLGNFPHVYDLSEAWKVYTGLPFMFAAWVANKALPPAFLNVFNQANEMGLSHIEEVAAAQYFPAYDLRKYYRENIVFRRNPELEKARVLFLHRMRTLRSPLF